MKALLDTHSFLWFIAGSGRLSRKAQDVILDLDNELILSMASLWEMAIKTSLGKLEFTHPFNEFIIAKTPAARWGKTEDLEGPAVFLASDASNFVNGHILYVDGGILAYIGKQPK